MSPSVSKKFWIKIGAIPAAMFAFSFAMIPLYEVLCNVTGLNGRSQSLVSASEDQYQEDDSRAVKIRFLGNVASGMPIDFYPLQTAISVSPGVPATVYYVARNTAGYMVAGRAVPSVAPESGATKLKKIECFCFRKQEFKPGETVQMPVQVVIDPDLDSSVEELTLSYTFYRIRDMAPAADQKIALRSPLSQWIESTRE